MSTTNGKIWQVAPKYTEEFDKKITGYNNVIKQLLFNRGIKDVEEADIFLNPRHRDVAPHSFRDMDKAIDLVVSHIKSRNKICVYGDYDADGVTSSALLVEILSALKAETMVYIPNRVSEGYGINAKAVKEIISSGAKLIITVDGGIRNKEEIGQAKKAGIDVIVTDHHLPPEKKEDMPDCMIIDPVIDGEIYPFRFLAGVGVAFRFAQAIIGKSKLADEQRHDLERKVLDLVAIGTIADCVTVMGENRLLIKDGLEELNKKGRVGLSELMKTAQLNADKKIDSWNVSFQIAPRLNAAGRMDHANTAFELLVTKDKNEAAAIAAKLNERNYDRQKVTEEIVDEVIAQINPEDKIIIGVCPEKVEDEPWKEGVVGLVAGRIAERYYRPTLIITRGEEGLKGSGRSIDGFNIVEALSEAKEYLSKYGGHPAACGFSLKSENLEKFKSKMLAVASLWLSGADLRPKLKIEAEIPLAKVDRQLADNLEMFSPFGQDNDKPKLASFGVQIVEIVKMGLEGQHLKLRLRGEESGIINAIGFGQSEKWGDLRVGDKIDIVYYVDLNEFNGRSEVQLKIVDIHQRKNE